MTVAYINCWQYQSLCPPEHFLESCVYSFYLNKWCPEIKYWWQLRYNLWKKYTFNFSLINWTEFNEPSSRKITLSQCQHTCASDVAWLDISINEGSCLTCTTFGDSSDAVWSETFLFFALVPAKAWHSNIACMWNGAALITFTPVHKHLHTPSG